MNRISIIGVGYVGLVTGACLAEFGMNVTCMDNDEKKIEQLKRLEMPIYEPGLEELVRKNVNSLRLSFTTDIHEAVQNSTAIFIAVGTPPQEDGSADISYILAVAKEIAHHLDSYHVIVNKSTVPVGSGRLVKETIKAEMMKTGRNTEFDIVSNPEFLREGAAIRDFMHPDRIVLGVESKKSEDIMRSIYNVLYLINRPFVITNLETAELIKYASNAFLATKISFINEIANLCENIDADINPITVAMGLDGRIGKYFLHPGPGFGGSCFPKDVRALKKIAEDNNSDLKVVEACILANENQKKRMSKKIINRLGDVREKSIAVLGLSFKPETDDIREAPSITVINDLCSMGAAIRAYDPVAMKASIRIFPEMKFKDCSDEYEACEGADALVIMTEWNQFRHLDLERIKTLLKKPIIFDFRNIYDPMEMKLQGFIYEGVGRR